MKFSSTRFTPAHSFHGSIAQESWPANKADGMYQLEEVRQVCVAQVVLHELLVITDTLEPVRMSVGKHSLIAHEGKVARHEKN